MRSEARRFPRSVAVAAIALGITAGSYGVASAASGGGSGGGSSTRATTTTSTRSAPSAHQHSDETALTGDTASKVRAAALARVPGGTIVRVETDGDGHAAYEAHMTDANGSRVTVYVNASLDVVSVETGGPGGHGRRHSEDSSTA